MSVTSDILDGVARILNTAGVGVYDPTRVWTTADTATAVMLKDLPPDPERVIALALFGANSDQPEITLGQVSLQVRCRAGANPVDVDDLADAAFAVLHGAKNLTFGTAHVVQILRTNSVPMGMDDQARRWQRADNYALDVDYPTSVNRPT